jgi:hypothetical protein
MEEQRFDPEFMPFRNTRGDTCCVRICPLRHGDKSVAMNMEARVGSKSTEALEEKGRLGLGEDDILQPSIR